MDKLRIPTGAWPSWLAVLILTFATPASARSVTDVTGRAVELPDRVERVMPAGQPAAVLLYVLAPEKMIGWPHTPSAAAAAFIQQSSARLPELGSLVHDGKVQSEQIRAAKPDLILDYGSTSPRYVERAKMVQEASGIPVLLLDGGLERAPEIFRQLGAVLGLEARADDLAVAAERLLAIVRQRIPAQPLRVFYARSADGLTTATSASQVSSHM